MTVLKYPGTGYGYRLLCHTCAWQSQKSRRSGRPAGRRDLAHHDGPRRSRTTRPRQLETNVQVVTYRLNHTLQHARDVPAARRCGLLPVPELRPVPRLVLPPAAERALVPALGRAVGAAEAPVDETVILMAPPVYPY